MRDYRKLVVWEKAHELCLIIYRITTKFPSEEKFGLVSQIRRAAVSIPANIAEGKGRDSQVELARFLDISAGSCNEVDCLIQISHDLGMVDDGATKEVQSKISEIRKMLHGLIDKIRND